MINKKIMEYCHTFLQPSNSRKRYYKSYLICQTLSFLFLRKNNLKTNLYSSSEHIRICKKIGLNYDNFYEIEHDPYYDEYWSYSKLSALKNKKNQIIVDLDTFLLKDISKNIDNADLIFQDIELLNDSPWYLDIIHLFKESVPYGIIPEWDLLINRLYLKDKLKSNFENEHAYNCAILGFKDMVIAEDFAKKSIAIYDFLREKYDIEYLKNTKSFYCAPIIPEQLFLKFYAEYHNLNCINIIKGRKIKNNFYCHIGGNKGDKNTEDKILKNIKNIDENIYQNLLEYIV
jgi:hypothetical protein